MLNTTIFSKAHPFRYALNKLFNQYIVAFRYISIFFKFYFYFITIQYLQYSSVHQNWKLCDTWFVKMKVSQKVFPYLRIIVKQKYIARERMNNQLNFRCNTSVLCRKTILFDYIYYRGNFKLSILFSLARSFSHRKFISS